MLTSLEQKIEPKLKAYQEMASRGSKLEMEQSIEEWNPCLGANTEHKGCECSVF